MEAYIINTKLELDPNAPSVQRFRRRGSADTGLDTGLGLPDDGPDEPVVVS